MKIREIVIKFEGIYFHAQYDHKLYSKHDGNKIRYISKTLLHLESIMAVICKNEKLGF